MIKNGYYKIEYIKSIIKRNFGIEISDLDIWHEYINGYLKSWVCNNEVYFDLSELLITFNPQRKNKKKLSETVKMSVTNNYKTLWNEPLDDYESTTDFSITNDELIQYNANRMVNKPLYKK